MQLKQVRDLDFVTIFGGHSETSFAPPQKVNDNMNDEQLQRQ